ncbi:unnamed protein product [Urochloa humidicola]
MRVYNKEMTHESTTKVAGTYGYMAPECTSGPKFQLSIKTDVYSYGVLVLEIITGHKIHTFEGQNSEGLVGYVSAEKFCIPATFFFERTIAATIFCIQLYSVNSGLEELILQLLVVVGELIPPQLPSNPFG